MNVAIIPARGGSKRIPRKNIRDFCGKPIIAWPIENAIKTKLFDHVLVSTDDKEIANISLKFGAEVPFIRPKKLADDFTGTSDVVAHAVAWMIEKGWPIKTVCCIYPTSVFVNEKDLLKGLKAIKSKKWKYSISVTNFEYNIFRAFKTLKNGGIEMFFPENFNLRSQDLPEALHDAAQFYWAKPSSWINHENLFNKNTYPVMIPRWRAQDIDTDDDWKNAESLFGLISEK